MLASNKEAGFTLVEILIAIFLLAIITLGVVDVTQNAMNNKERTTRINNDNLAIESAMSRFEWDFSQIYSPLYFSTVQNMQFSGGAAANQGYGNGANDGFTGGNMTSPMNSTVNSQPTLINPALQMYYAQMMSRFERNERFATISKEGEPVPKMYAPEKGVFEFFTSSNRRKMENTLQSHFAWVRYQLGEQDHPKDEEKVHPDMPASLKTFVRYFSADNPYDDNRFQVANGLGSIKGAVLLENVESLEFFYWDLQKRKWEQNIRAIQNGDLLIRGVKVNLVWWDSTGRRSISRIFRPHWPLVAPNDAAANAAQPGTTPSPAPSPTP